MTVAEIDAILDEFGWNAIDMAKAILKLRQDLDEAVGYKLAIAQETRGDHGYEEG